MAALYDDTDSGGKFRKHALRGKEGERNLWITVDRQERGIRIKITDNGGGYRPDSRHRGTGTGMKVIMQTIQILNMKIRKRLMSPCIT